MSMRAATIVACGALCSTNALAGIITPEQTFVEVLPGSQVSILWLAQDIATPLFGYSLDITPVTASRGATSGLVGIDLGATNFFPDRNLILAGGAELDPLFSVIQDNGSGGVFVSTNTADFSAILPVAGVNDVLAEVVFVASADALGDFVFDLGPATALSDASGFPVDFTSQTLTIRVIPAPMSAGVLSIAALATTRRRRS